MWYLERSDVVYDESPFKNWYQKVSAEVGKGGWIG